MFALAKILRISKRRGTEGGGGDHVFLGIPLTIKFPKVFSVD